MTLRSRLRHLERRTVPPGACPVCGIARDAIRFIEWVFPAGSPPADESETDPPRPLCRGCGLPMLPIRFITVAAGEPVGES